MRFKLIAGIILLIAVAIGSMFAWNTYHDDAWDIAYRMLAKAPLRVVSVADGDTFTVTLWFGKKMAVRPLGINAPELAHAGLRIRTECFAEDAARYASAKLLGRLVHLDFDTKKGVREDHGRLLAYVWVYDNRTSYYFGSGLDFNKDMLETGHAEEWTYKGSYRRQHEFQDAEESARKRSVGGWAACPHFDKHKTKERRSGKPQSHNLRSPPRAGYFYDSHCYMHTLTMGCAHRCIGQPISACTLTS